MRAAPPARQGGAPACSRGTGPSRKINLGSSGFAPFVIARGLSTLVCYCHTCAASTPRAVLPRLQSLLDQALSSEASEEEGFLDGFAEALPRIQELWHNFLKASMLDYRGVILELARSFLWRELKKGLIGFMPLQLSEFTNLPLQFVILKSCQYNFTTLQSMPLRLPLLPGGAQRGRRGVGRGGDGGPRAGAAPEARRRLRPPNGRATGRAEAGAG